MTAVVTIGETMGLFRARSVGPLATTSEFTLSIGGAESNVAVGLARLGVSVRWIGRVGNDPIGRRVVRELRGEGIDIHATVDDEAPTAMMVREQRIPGSSRVQYFRAGSAGSRLTESDVAPELIEDAAILHVTGITPALSNTAHEAIRTAIRIARSSGVAVSFDVNYRSQLWQRTSPLLAYRELVSLADVVFAGAEEARILFPTVKSPVALAQNLCDLGPTQAVVKLGGEGCVAVIDGVIHKLDSRKVATIDTVGAGDAFAAGYLAGLAERETAQTRLETAVTAGAFACLNEGDWEGYPTRADLALLDATDSVQR